MSDADVYDAAVAGCGPAGNTVAYELGRRGFRVLLLDKAKLPRDKPCGGGLSGKTLGLLPYAIDPVIERRTSGAFLAYRDEARVHTRWPGAGAMVDRRAFDGYMTEKAVESGAVLRDATELTDYEEGPEAVVLATSAGTFRARVLVGADGALSRVRRRMYPGGRMLYGVALMAKVHPRGGVPAWLAENTLFDFGAVRGGYGWIFPKADHLNAGVFRTGGVKGPVNLRRLLEDLLGRNGVLGPMEAKAWPVPVKPAAGRLATGRVVLVGDAAGMADALFGEGISYAVSSARLASEAIAGCLERGEPLAGYGRAARRIGRELFFSRLAARMVYSMPRCAYYGMLRRRWVVERVARVLRGEMSHARCCAALAVAFPLWVLGRNCDAVDAAGARPEQPPRRN